MGDPGSEVTSRVAAKPKKNKKKSSKTKHTPYDDDAELADDLRKLKSDTKKRIAKWCAEQRPSASAVLVPVVRRSNPKSGLTFHQRLPLPAERITFLGLDP